jgi:ligand-binding sensor domain-containing protein/signal transduction histidine kinase
MRPKCQRIFLVLLALLPTIALASTPGFLPQDLTLKAWTKQQGLPDDAVSAVLQTHDGYLWVGTSAGLARFDGLRFVTVAPVWESTNQTLRVTALCEDGRGRLWVGTQGDGLFCYADDALRPYRAPRRPLDRTINTIAADGGGRLWLGTPSGLAVIETNRVLQFTSRDGLVNDFVSNIHIARSGMIWITTHGGMCQFRNGQIYPYPFQTDSPGRNPESLGVYEDRSGNLWAFGDTYLVNLTEGKHLNHFGGGDNLSTLRIWSLCEGRQGELWIGTSGRGLYCFADGRFIPITLRNGGLTSEVRALCEDREGNLWLGTYGGGLVRLQPRNVKVLDAAAGLPNRPAVCLAVDRQGRALVGLDGGGVYTGTIERFERLTGEAAFSLQDLVSCVALAPDSSTWVGTPGDGLYCLENGGVTHYGTANGLADNSIASLAADDHGVVWAGTLAGSLSRIDGSTLTNFGARDGLPSQPITALLAASRGPLWIGYGDGRVVRGRGENFTSVIEPSVLRGQAVRALHEDAAGRIWLGTAGGQLACILPGRYLNWDLNLPPADDVIQGILSDDDGDLWLSTARDIYHLVQSDITASLARQIPLRPQLVFEADSPFGAAAPGWPQAAKSPDGKLLFGMVAGVVTVDPNRLVVDAPPLPVLIEDVTVNGRPLPHREIIPSAESTNPSPAYVRLPSNLRSLDIQFTALNLSDPERVRFRHRFDGPDFDWVEGGAERSVHYEHLNYGRYTFRVQAGVGAVWDSTDAVFSFLVPTPLWRTAWAEFIYALAAGAMVAGTARVVSHRRLRRRLTILAQQQAMERERMRIAKDMHDEIGSKLTKISFMSERAKGELRGNQPAADRIESIARTSRDLLQSLDEIVWAVNPHNDTLEHLAAYLGHYATEYLQNTTVECQLHIQQNLPDYPLSAEVRHNLFLAFGESLSNALKHGRAAHIRVVMQAEPTHFEITIQDDGCGFDTRATALLNPNLVTLGGKRVGNGMRNLQQRLGEVGGVCHIRSQPGQGTTVTLSFPLTGVKNGKFKPELL